MRRLGRFGTRLVNVALFLLSTNVPVRLTLFLTTVGAWWLLSDFYLAPWPWWMDRFAFMAFSLMVFLGITLGVFWFRLQRPSRRIKTEYDLLRQPAHAIAFPVRHWCALLRKIASFDDGLWAEYWTWYCLRLERFSKNAPDRHVNADSLATLWWPQASAIKIWLLALCLPALWATLLLIPLKTNLMEHFARWIDTDPQQIFDIRCVGRDPVTRKPFQETLRRDASGFYRKGQCAFLANGEFEVSTTPFPRVYRRLLVGCTNRCAIVPRKNAAPVLDHPFPVRAGESSFEWMQTSPESPLGMSLTLVRRDGKPIDKTSIEP